MARQPGQSLPTIRDVARLAGVSKTTASDALQSRGRVSKETRARVEEAATKLGYTPHAGARDLTRQRSEVIGLLVGDFYDPFNAEFTAHLEHQAAANGFRVLLATAGPDLSGEETAISNLLEHRVAALILIAYTGGDAQLRSIGSHTQVVSVGYNGSVGTAIGLDDVTGARMAVDHLLELRHRRIAYVSGTILAPATDAARIAGYRAALRSAKVDSGAGLLCNVGPRDDPERMGSVRELLQSPDRPTAFFAASDITAIEVMSEALELGLQVPDDLSIVGFDNMMLASVPMISLTTIAQPVDELARLSIKAVMDGLNGSPPKPTLLEPTLVVRRSSAPAPIDDTLAYSRDEVPSGPHAR
ncbi:MAG: LacI family DNA-binding transcriptional regulator [Actinobacteria bacterium]|nr:LacI family DNA-binding transcriptional regulator [Actinomycetota bacterium]